MIFLALRIQSTLFSPTNFKLSLSERVDALDCTQLRCDVLFLDRTRSNKFHRPLQSSIKHLCLHQSFQQIQQTMQCFDVFVPALTNEEQNEKKLFPFQIFE
jgi:hypothetical protein